MATAQNNDKIKKKVIDSKHLSCDGFYTYTDSLW